MDDSSVMNSDSTPNLSSSEMDSGEKGGQEEQHPAFSDVAAADAQIDKLRFGYVSHYHQPFSNQIRDEIRTAFPVDKAIYDDADKAEQAVMRQYFFLRVLTFITFLGFLAFSQFAIQQYFLGSVIIFGPAAPTAGFLSFLLTAVLIITAWILLFGIRFLVRAYFMKEIVRTAERFAHTVSQRFSDVQSQMFEAANNIRDRIGPVKWPQSAEMWAKSALWKAKRAEYLDRYSTTIAWKNSTFMAQMEIGAIIVKALLVVGSIAYIFLHYSPSAANATVQYLVKATFSVLIISGFVFGWSVIIRKRNDFWTAAFTKEVCLEAVPQSHYYNTIPRIIANIVATIQSNERNSSPS